MKKFLSKGVVSRLTGSLAVGLVLLGVFGSQQALAQIAGTKHNLSSGGSFDIKLNVAAGSTEICVFCHTPHGADTSAIVPLWNKNFGSSTYQTYNSLGTTSLDGAMTAVGSVSLACLSCHDGTQAMNVMINAPGSGGYNAAGALFGTFVANAKHTDGKLDADAGITLIGTDLRDDHPISIQYAGGPRTADSLPDVPLDYWDFEDPDFNTARSALLNGKPVWWVDTGTQGNGRQKTDMQLYTRATDYTSGTSTILASKAQPYVECASCHDPHVSANPTFLRIANTGSALCLACHVK